MSGVSPTRIGTQASCALPVVPASIWPSSAARCCRNSGLVGAAEMIAGYAITVVAREVWEQWIGARAVSLLAPR
jgi:hypothetical protein